MGQKKKKEGEAIRVLDISMLTMTCNQHSVISSLHVFIVSLVKLLCLFT